MEKITLGGGCFWCTQALFKRLKGVKTVVSGYAGGVTSNPSSEQVSRGTTGHAEAVQISFDPEVVSLDKLLEIFWFVHDSTTVDQQGADIGPQYRSVIFYHTRDQKQAAERSKSKLERSGKYKDPVVTEIVELEEFFKAEDYHQNYFEKNPAAAYCMIVINPKLKKLLDKYTEVVKK